MASPLTKKAAPDEAAEIPVAEPGGAVSRPTVREIFDEHAAHVWRTLRHLGIPEADVPDVSQEVFLTVHRKLPDFEGRSKLKTWIYGICLRVASDHRRRAYVRRERATAEPASEVEAAGAPPDSHADARVRLLRLLDTLDEDRRNVVVLYEIEGLSMKEIAELLGCPLQTAYSRLHAARRHLAEQFGAKEPTP